VWVAVEIVAKLLIGIPVLQMLVMINRFLLSPSSSSCSLWPNNRPTVNCCSTKIAIKLLSSPVIDCQYYYKRQKASTAVVMALPSPSSLSSSMPAQQVVEEEDEKKEEKPPSNVSSFLKF
jgi:hypothetical protein